MQASSLSILVDEKRVEDLLKQKSGAKAFLRSACNLLAFIFFITLFTVMALGEPLSVHRSFEAYVRHRFDTGSAVRLDEVNDISGFYHYWNHTLIPGLYSNDTRQYTFPGAQMQAMLKLDGEKANNRLFGLARVRMKKVLPDIGCQVQSIYESYFTTCYGPFSAENEDQAEYGPISQIGGAMFKYTPDSGEKEHAGWLASYPGGGFQEAMYGNYTRSVELVDTLKANRWMDAAARVAFFEFTIYNLNTGLYAVCRIAFEISPVGGWLKTFEIDILDQRHLKPLGDGGLTAWMLLIMEATLVLFVVRYLCEEASEFIACDGHGKNPLAKIRIKTDYFTDGWNIIDWGNLVLMIVVMGLRFANWGISQAVTLKIGTSLSETDYTNLHDVVLNVRVIRQLTAFNAVLTWFKAVKYINILPYIGTFMETMALSWRHLVGWTAIFFTSLMGFSLSYCTAFGESISDFRTVPRAFVFLMRSFIGNADMSLVYDANPVIGSLLILMFVVSMIFVNLNLFYAILISYMSDARQSQEMQQQKEWNKFSEKIQGFGSTVVRVLQLQARFRGTFPGLWSRMKKWEKERMDLEKKRDDAVALKAKLSQPHEDVETALGSASPNCGRRRRRVYKAEAKDDDDDAKSEAESEPDLGPLRFKEDLEPQKDYALEDLEHMHHHHHHHHHHHALEDEHNDKDEHPDPMSQPPPGMIPGFPGLGQQEEEEDRDEEAKALVLEATSHVVHTIKERCKGARHLVVTEMGEARQVLHGIGNVLEVLGRRARSLEAQQEQILPAEVVMRVKKEAEEEEY